MPNYCSYSLRAVGEKENLQKLVHVIKSRYSYETDKDGKTIETRCDHKHLFRVFDVNILKKTGKALEIDGTCAWSVYSCMFSGDKTYYDECKKDFGDAFKGTCLTELSKELNLDIEVFSEEYGMQFMEHYLIRKGDLKIDECVEWIEEENEETGEYETVSGGLEWEFRI